MLYFSENFYLHRTKIYIFALLTIGPPIQSTADTIGIIAGPDLIAPSPPYAALVSSSDELLPLTFSGDIATKGLIYAVSMNSSGTSIIGGENLNGSQPAYAALVSSSGEITPLTIDGLPGVHGIINSVAINSLGESIIGGRDTTGPIYAALVPPSGSPLIPLTFSDPISAGGIINSVTINDSGTCLIGGQGYYDMQPAYLAFVSPLGIMNPVTLTGGIAIYGTIHSTSINSTGTGIFGGQDLTGSQPGYAALVSSLGTVTPLTLTENISTNGIINSVAINDSGIGIIGGQDLTGSQPGYAALVSSLGTVTPLALTENMSTNGIINSVAINSSGNAIIGGQDLTGSQPAYAALVSSSGTVTPLILTGGGISTSGVIYSVAIDNNGNALIGGEDLTGSNPAYAALVTPTGTIIPLTLTGDMANNGWINSVALLKLTILPPLNLQGVQNKNNFGLLYEFYNELTWTPSPSPETIGYFIYRDNEKIATVNASTYSYQDHNRKKGVSYTYTITAINSTGAESASAQIVISP